MTIIFTDGSSRGNPGPGGWGLIVASENHVEEFGGGEKHTTNNRMELTALIEGLRRVSVDAPLTVCLDSQYVKRGATEWLRGWERGGWMTKSKQPVENQDLWEAIAQLLDLRTAKTTWVHVRGHDGVPGNDRVDTIATSFADENPPSLYRGGRSEYEIDLEKTIGNGRASASSSRGGKAYSYVSRIDGVVMTHTNWSECEKRVKGKPGAKFKKVFSREEEEKLIHEWGKQG